MKNLFFVLAIILMATLFSLAAYAGDPVHGYDVKLGETLLTVYSVSENGDLSKLGTGAVSSIDFDRVHHASKFIHASVWVNETEIEGWIPRPQKKASCCARTGEAECSCEQRSCSSCNGNGCQSCRPMQAVGGNTYIFGAAAPLPPVVGTGSAAVQVRQYNYNREYTTHNHPAPVQRPTYCSYCNGGHGVPIMQYGNGGYWCPTSGRWVSYNTHWSRFYSRNSSYNRSYSGGFGGGYGYRF